MFSPDVPTRVYGGQRATHGVFSRSMANYGRVEEDRVVLLFENLEL